MLGIQHSSGSWIVGIFQECEEFSEVRNFKPWGLDAFLEFQKLSAKLSVHKASLGRMHSRHCQRHSWYTYMLYFYSKLRHEWKVLSGKDIVNVREGVTSQYIFVSAVM